MTPTYYARGKKTGRNATLNVTGLIGFFLDTSRATRYTAASFRSPGLVRRQRRTPTAPLRIRHPAGAVTMARLTSVIVSDDDGFRRQLAGLFRAAAVPSPCHRRSIPAEGVHPMSSSLTAEPRRRCDGGTRQGGVAERRHLLRGARRGSGLDSPVDAGGRQRIPDVAAGATRPWTKRSGVWRPGSRRRRGSRLRRRRWSSSARRVASGRRPSP